MTQDALISKYSEHIAEDMFQHLCAHVGANLNTIVVKDDSYSLLGALNEIRKGLMLPQVCKFRLQGYDLRSILEGNAEPMIKAALKGTGMKFEITFHPLTATLKLWKKKPDVAVAVLYYDSFEEDLQKTIAYYGH